jgi:hypothetical protein
MDVEQMDVEQMDVEQTDVEDNMRHKTEDNRREFLS